jgi:ABC-type sulfate transport system substrate-binding protein
MVARKTYLITLESTPHKLFSNQKKVYEYLFTIYENVYVAGGGNATTYDHIPVGSYMNFTRHLQKTNQFKVFYKDSPITIYVDCFKVE